MRILVINSGSSSIKYKLYTMPGNRLLVRGSMDRIGEKNSPVKDHHSGLKKILQKIDGVSAVGHRVVHGAERFKKPVIITASVIREIRLCCSIAPLHNPANLEGILACKKLLPGVKQVAVFDTAFHQSLPEHAYIYGLPYRYYRKYGIRKYGFHGTSHEYVAQRAAEKLKKPLKKLKLITCHLGNGCSITAVDRGRSVDTSMGFTPLEGLVMGTRCGDIDPALVTFIMKKDGLDAGGIDKTMNEASGLKGISGIGNDMRIIERKKNAGNRLARLAWDIFSYRIKKYIGAYAAIMGGVNAIVFTAGIGEHQRSIRQEICRGIFAHFKNKPKILVIPTDEELMIAQSTFKLVKKSFKRR